MDARATRAFVELWVAHGFRAIVAPLRVELDANCPDALEPRPRYQMRWVVVPPIEPVNGVIVFDPMNMPKRPAIELFFDSQNTTWAFQHVAAWPEVDRRGFIWPEDPVPDDQLMALSDFLAHDPGYGENRYPLLCRILGLDEYTAA
jgi:hypothetical protein